MIINCFYHSKFSYTIVPWQIEEDIQRIASAGASVMTLNVLEQDWKAARENIQLVMNLARQAGLKLYFTPEGWLGRFHTINGFPSVFSVKNMDTVIKSEKGNGYFFGSNGPVSELTHAKSVAFLRQKLEECFQKFGFDGIVWDRPVLLPQDNTMKPSASRYFSALNESIGEEYGAVDILWRSGSLAKGVAFKEKELKGLTLAPEEFAFFDHTGYNVLQIEKMKDEINDILAQKPAMFGYYDYPANVAAPQKAMGEIVSCLKRDT